MKTLKNPAPAARLRLPAGLGAAARRKAAAQERSFSGYVRRLIRRDLQRARIRPKTTPSHAQNTEN